MAKIVNLIYTEKRIGLGKEGSPTRLCPELWSKDGKLIARIDPCKNGSVEFYPENIK